MMDTAAIPVKVGEDGSVTLPADLCRRFNFVPGETLNALDVDGALMLTTSAFSMTEAALDIERARLEAGITMEELFAGLREERERYYEEKYGSSTE